MCRRAGGRDAGLVARMLAVLVMIAVTLAVAGAALLSLFFILPTWWPLWTLICIGLVFSVAREVRSAETTILEIAEASVVSPEEAPELHEQVERVAAMLDLPAPEIAISRTDIPHGFVVGKRRRRTVIAVGEEMRRKLDAEELEAVIAHELSHVANRDSAVMTVASLPRIVGRQLFYAEGNEYFLWFFLWPFGLLLYGWGSLLTLAISRYREYIADRGASLVTGRPAELMSALQKLAAEIERIPHEDLRSVRRLNPLLIVSAKPERFALVRDHPPLAKRLARLASIARELGKPER